MLNNSGELTYEMIQQAIDSMMTYQESYIGYQYRTQQDKDLCCEFRCCTHYYEDGFCFRREKIKRARKEFLRILLEDE